MMLRAFRVIFRSLRGRIVLGAVFWSAGFIVLINHVLAKMVRALFPHLSFNSYAFSFLGTILILMGLVLVSNTMRKVEKVRRSVASLRTGAGTRVEGEGLEELEPLIRDMNALLDHRERVARRAMATAGDLAHGLKTPLAIVAQEAEQLELAHQTESAATIAEQVERMRRQVDYHLARARASASGAPYGEHVELRPVAERVVRTIGRLFVDKGPEFIIDIDESLTLRCETEDLEEMLGNLLENACKFTRSAVTISASRNASGVMIVVDDDGPGIAPADRQRFLQRGVRADEAPSGAGLGLAIVGDLVDLYGGSLTLDTSPSGGLRVQMVLP